MYLQRTPGPGELTVTVTRAAFCALSSRAAARGMTPEEYVESLARDAYRHPFAEPNPAGPEERPGYGHGSESTTHEPER